LSETAGETNGRDIRTTTMTLRLGLLVASAASALVLTSPGAAFAGANPSVVGSVADASTLPGATSVAVSGTHAYTTAYFAGTLASIDISNPARPLIAGASASTKGMLASSTVNIASGYAYVASKNRNGPKGSNSNDDGTGNSLTIVDISTNPAKPAVAGSIRDAVNLFGAYGVAVSGHYAFVASQGCLSGQPCPNSAVGNSFAVIDVASKSAPKIVATLRNNSLPAPWTGSGALSHACSVAVSGNYAYVTAAYSNRLTVIDITNPLSPTIVASLLDATQLDFPVDVAVAGGYAYVADQGGGLGRLAVVDVRNPVHPQVVGLVNKTSTLLNGAYRVRLRGNFAFVSAISAGAVSAVDISDPTAPRFAGGLSAPSLNRSTGLDVDSTGRYVVASSPYRPTEILPVYPPYPLQGGPVMTGTVSTIDLEPAPLGVTIAGSSKPPNPTTQGSANFTFSTNDSVSTVRCRLDAAPFSLCTTPGGQTYNSLGSGSHTFTVQVIDAAGNTATDSYSWTINGSSAGAPVTPILDNFNRTNGGAGAAWSLIEPSGFAPMNVATNTAVDSSRTRYAWNYWNAATFGPDCEAYATVAAHNASDTIRIGARVSGAGTTSPSGYYVAVNSSGWSILRIDNGGSPVTLASAAIQPLSSGDKLAIRIVGSLVTALHYTKASGWVQVLSYDTAGDSIRYGTAGRIALEFRSSSLDDFGGGTI
jgi:hypothetical protein